MVDDATRERPGLKSMIVAEVPHLGRYAVSLTHDRTRAEDLLQSCLERALSRLDQFRPDTDMRRWLFTIMRNLHIDDCRAAQRRGPHIPFEDRHCRWHYPAAQEHRIRLGEVRRKLGELRKDEQQIILLSALTGISQEAMARRMNVAVGTVRSRLSRARSALAA